METGGFSFGTPTVPIATTFSIKELIFTSEPNTSGDNIVMDTTQPSGLSVIYDTAIIPSKLGYNGLTITDKTNITIFEMRSVSFNGSGDGLVGLEGTDPNVFIDESCTGVIPTPTHYWARYHDNATTVTPIPLPNNTQTKITSDGLGVGLIERSLPSTITDLWDIVLNKVLLSDINIGRPILFTVSGFINVTQNNTTVDLRGIGLDTAQTPFFADTISVAAKNQPIYIEKPIYIDVKDADLQANGVEVFLTILDPLTATGTFEVDHVTIRRG
jgi:hypothetical protein